MTDLTPRERELVAIGAALGSNCVPCVEYHIAESRKLGIVDADIYAAIQHADKIRQVPARRTLTAALHLLSATAGAGRDTATAESCGCGDTLVAETKAEPCSAAQPRDMMMGMMSKMMEACAGHGQRASAANSTATKPAAQPATDEGYGCR